MALGVVGVGWVRDNIFWGVEIGRGEVITVVES